MKALQKLVNKQVLTIGGMLFFILSLVFAFSTPTPTVQAASDKIVLGYYTSWAPPENLDPNKLTHITYAFADVCWDSKHGNPNNEEIPDGEEKTWPCRTLDGDLYEDAPANGTIVLYDYETDLVELPKLEALKQVNPNLKTIVSVGGWTLSNNLSLVAATEETRETFAQSAVDFVRKFNLDGLDLDWEYPNAEGHPGNNKGPEDKENHTKILQAVRDAFDVAGAEDGKDYLLSIAGAQTWAYSENNELAQIGEIVDFAMIMAYDTNGTWTGLTGHNAPVFGDPLEEELRGWASGSADGASNMYFWEGIPSNKIVLGVPFYGHAWAGCNIENDGAFNPANGAYQNCKPAWEQTGDVPGTVGYDVVKDLIGKDGYEYYFDDVAKAPYLYNAAKGEFVSYDNIETLEHKMELIKNKGLGGAMIWDLATDDADYNLLKTVSYNLGVANEQPDEDPKQPRAEVLNQSVELGSSINVQAKQKVNIAINDEQSIYLQLPNVLQDKAILTVTEADSTVHAGTPPTDFVFAGGAYTFDLGESNQANEERFLVKLPIPTHLQNTVTLGAYNNEANRWEVVEGSFVREGSLVATVNELSTFGVLISSDLVYNDEDAFPVYANGVISNENKDFIIQLPSDLPFGTTFNAEEVERETIDADGLEVAGKVFRFEFDFNGNEAYTDTFHLSLKADKNASYPLIFKFNEETNNWDEIGGTLTDGYIPVELDGFSTYGVFTKNSQQGEDGDKGETGDKGEIGDKGEQGDKGETGDKGEQDDDGVIEGNDEGENKNETNQPSSNNESQKEQSITNKSQSNTQQPGAKLPNTATTTFNMLLIGMVLLLIGSISFYFTRKKKA